jgi:hypothetical protein
VPGTTIAKTWRRAPAATVGNSFGPDRLGPNEYFVFIGSSVVVVALAEASRYDAYNTIDSVVIIRGIAVAVNMIDRVVYIDLCGDLTTNVVTY